MPRVYFLHGHSLADLTPALTALLVVFALAAIARLLHLRSFAPRLAFPAHDQEAQLADRKQESKRRVIPAVSYRVDDRLSSLRCSGLFVCELVGRPIEGMREQAVGGI